MRSDFFFKHYNKHCLVNGAFIYSAYSEYYVPWYVQPFFCIFVISSQTLCMILLIGLGSINTYSTNDDSGEEPKHTHTHT